MKNLFNYISILIGLIAAILSTPSCKSNTDSQIASLKMNEVQVIGSHNSYKKQIQPAILELLQKEESGTAISLDYQHISLTRQLEMGLRNLELDVVCDPEGGRFASPYGNKILEMQKIKSWRYDSTGEMMKPGFKVMHVPDLDFRSWCPLFTDGLKQIKAWSEANIDHLPIIITINAKSDAIKRDGFTSLLPFTQASFDSLDNEILSVFPAGQIIEPDDVRGGFKTLNEAVMAKQWPLLDSVRGKVVFVLDDEVEKQNTYIKNHPSLQDRVMFVNEIPGTNASAFIILNDPVTYHDSIAMLVKQGYIVRTRADADTREARLGDYKRLTAAMSSGAQVISTDYYLPDDRLGTGYHVELPGGLFIRYNPVLLSDSLSGKIRE